MEQTGEEDHVEDASTTERKCCDSNEHRMNEIRRQLTPTGIELNNLMTRARFPPSRAPVQKIMWGLYYMNTSLPLIAFTRHAQ